MAKHYKKSKPNICAYCGILGDTTSDHIPPKNLFPDPRPSNLVSVPACKVCHGNTAKDDEYFRLKIIMRDGVLTNPNARAVWKTSVLDSLKRTKASGLRIQTMSDLTYVNLKTKSGLYVGRRFGYNVNMNRIRRVVQRIVRGLYFSESGKPLGLYNEVRVNMDEDLMQQPPEFLEQLKQTILNPLASLPPKIIDNNTFLYRYYISKENPVISVWGLSFYGHVQFLAITGPPHKLRNSHRNFT
jgi:hypothetical protein